MKNKPTKRSQPAQTTPAAATGDSMSAWLPYFPVVAAVVMFAGTLGFDMLGMDDHMATIENPAVRNFSLETLTGQFNLGMFAPMTWLVYAIAYALGGENPFGYHFFSVAVHAFNAWLVYRLLDRQGVRQSVVLGVALLFAVHPIQVESVAWIAGFSTPLFSMFSLLGMLAYQKHAHRQEADFGKDYALALLFFTLACLAKSTAVSLPLVLLVLDFWKKPVLSTTKRWLGYVPFFGIALAFGLYTFHTRSASGVPATMASDAYSLFDRFLMVCYTPLLYWGKLLIPVNLHIYYAFEKTNGQFPPVYFIAPFLLSGIVYLAWRWRENHPFLYRGLLFYGANILFFLPLYTVGTFELCADHYNYLASIGFFYLLGEGWITLQKLYPRYIGNVMPWIWGIIIAMLCFMQTRIWKNTLSVFNHAIEKGAYQNGKMFYWRGIENGDVGNQPAALSDFNTALEMDSTLMDAYKFRGSLYAQAGQLEAALADLEKYLKSDPENVGVWNNVAMIHMRLNHLPEALNAFNKTIELKPDVPISYQNRSKVYEMMGDKLRAQEDIQKAISIAGKRNKQ